MRNVLQQARELMNKQDAYCRGDTKAGVTLYPESLELQPLVELLRGRAVLNVHCYTLTDIEMIMRLAEEFNFRLASLHHAHEAYKLSAAIARANISVALFADNYGYECVCAILVCCLCDIFLNFEFSMFCVLCFHSPPSYKMEALDGRADAARILARAGVAVAIKVFRRNRIIIHTRMI